MAVESRTSILAVNTTKSYHWLTYRERHDGNDAKTATSSEGLEFRRYQTHHSQEEVDMGSFVYEEPHRMVFYSDLKERNRNSDQPLWDKT